VQFCSCFSFQSENNIPLQASFVHHETFFKRRRELLPILPPQQPFLKQEQQHNNRNYYYYYYYYIGSRMKRYFNLHFKNLRTIVSCCLLWSIHSTSSYIYSFMLFFFSTCTYISSSLKHHLLSLYRLSHFPLSRFCGSFYTPLLFVYPMLEK
jgi:hypothetical protein